jgi:tripartite ATP-independent transporter DctM subunit
MLMDAQALGILIFTVLGAFLLLGFPIGFAILISTCTALAVQGLPMSMAAMKALAGADTFLLTAIPFFILAGALMNLGGVTQRILNFCMLFLGSVRGSLGHVTIVSSMIFAGISGSSVAETASIGSIVIPAMKKKGYPAETAGAITCVAGTIGIIIPPSIPMVLYAMVSEASIGKLFLGGAVPGIMIGLIMMAITAYQAKKHGYGKERETRAGAAEIAKGVKDGILAIIMPFIIIGGIILGVVTATEAAVIAVAYAFLLGRFVYREIRIDQLPGALMETVRSTAVVMLVVVAATALGWVLAYANIPQMMSDVLLSVSDNRYIVLLIINLILLVAGCVSDVAPNILVLTPIFFPVINKLGIDPVHFGVMVTVNMAIGLVTPPVGNCLFIAANLSKVSLEKLFGATLPYLMASFIVLGLITFIPQLVLFLPNLLMGR